MSPPLSSLTTLRLGGPARRFVAAESEQQLIEAVWAGGADDGGLFVLGGGSNVVVADVGFRGLTVLIATSGRRVFAGSRGRVRLEAAAGENWDALVEDCVDAGFSGLEALSGIPGTVGATPIQNVGAYGQQISDTLVSVRAYDRVLGKTVSLTKAQCRFDYRTSRFRIDPDRHIVLAVTFDLERTHGAQPLREPEVARTLGVAVGSTPPLPDVRCAVLACRRNRAMVLEESDHDTWSAGSFFTNCFMSQRDFAELEARATRAVGSDAVVPGSEETDGSVKVFAAGLIELAGFKKGHPLGIDPAASVSISTRHVLALTNRGDGTTEELVALASEIAGRVHRMFGVVLEPEPVFVGHDWRHPTASPAPSVRPVRGPGARSHGPNREAESLPDPGRPCSPRRNIASTGP